MTYLYAKATFTTKVWGNREKLELFFFEGALGGKSRIVVDKKDHIINILELDSPPRLPRPRENRGKGGSALALKRGWGGN